MKTIGTMLCVFSCGLAFGAFGIGGAYGVRVNSFLDNDWKLTRHSRLCFDPENTHAMQASLTDRSVAADIIRICSLVAAEKGIQVVDPRASKCHPIKVEWSKAAEYGSCSGFLNARCTVYRKQLSFGFSHFDPKDRRIKEIHRVAATMKTPNPTFNIQSAEVLCRAIFHDFPEKLVNAKYRAKPLISLSRGY